ncbi:glycosyltransferase [Pantoea sp. SM3]|uniref:glycosyltransferase n=1 Tax=Pantoea sp. SM3 TaxID=1628192 RepID=UPI0005F8722D|nr:glycosyltransferase [Pantoea sp. SM3]KJV31000.1 O-antigen biosynthesis protein [Pantoea sp. SM3]
MTQNALVTIIINAQIPTWFAEALDSALAQDYPSCEIIIADCSGDKYITELLQPYLAQPGFTLRHITYDVDYPKLYEEVIAAAEGTYIKFMTDAERLAPNCVSQLVATMEAHFDCVVAAAKRERINALGVPLPDLIATAAFTREPSMINGLDFLRYQTTLHFNLIGELTAALFRREDLLAIHSEEQPLTHLNGEEMPGVQSLVIYSKLLAKGHLAYHPLALCSIRVSDVYTQPQQHEGREHIIVKREAVFDALRCKEWYSQQQGALNMVNIAPLEEPNNLTRQNLSAIQHSNLNLNALQHWQGARKLLPFQQDYLQSQLPENGEFTSLAVVITAWAGQEDKLAKTLASLPASQGPLQIHPLVIGNAQGAHYQTNTPVERIAVINHLTQEHHPNWFMYVEAGTEFQSSGVIALAASLFNAGEVLALYADEFFYIDGQPNGTAFRPDFNLDLLFSSPKTMSQHWLYRRELLLAAEGLDAAYPAAAELDLIVKLIESQGFGVIGHLSEPLLLAPLRGRTATEDVAIIERHLQHRGYPNAQIALDNYYNYRLRYEHGVQPKVTLAILANWHLPSLLSCVTTVLEKTSYHHYEIVIVVDNQTSPERESWLQGISAIDEQRIRVVQYDGEWQQAEMANLAAAHAKGDYLALLHCELAVTDGEWLSNLLNHAQRPEVAIVGGKQLMAGNKVRHAGYLLGVNGAASDAFRGMDDAQPSYLGRLHTDQNYSAVSGDFMLVRKAVFDELGGFDKSMTLFADVDFCLRVREVGYMTVWTPYARILRPAARQNPFQGASVHNTGRLKQIEEDKIFTRWMPIVAHDPAFNANLSLKSRHFDVNKHSNLSWRPVERPGLPVIMAHNADVAGCGYYRVITPLEAMQAEGIAEGKTSIQLLSHSELGQYKPDTLLIQRRYSPAFQQWIERAGRLSDVYKVFELDDYILNVPMKHYRRGDFRQEIAGQLRKTLSYFDRFVVSTHPLAEALGDMHDDIVVMPNRLPVNWWGNLHSLRNQGKKPRIGWAGGASHTGDLEMIVDIVKEFSGEVEWVFFGMCPRKLRPYIDELHCGVDITLYPAKLASLNLDLALAPVEDNLFNSCKSNLRLMEYGACGIPVICSDVECYRNTTLPVTRVKNRFKDWVDAIRMHLEDSAHSERTGLALQAELRRDWMLTGDNLHQWVNVWTGK